MKNCSTICPLPWQHLATHPDGVVSLCCQSLMKNAFSMAKNQDGLMRVGKNSIQEIVNSDLFNEVRLSMMADEQHPACAPCYQREAQGGSSKRLYELGRYSFDKELAKKITNDRGQIHPRFKFIELRLGNKCNLRCLTCNPNSSKLLQKDFKKMREGGLSFVTDYSHADTGAYDWPENELFWEELFKYADELEEIYINGGEPMLSSEHLSFLKRLAGKEIAKKVSLTYSSNMTVLNLEVINLWKNFKKVRIEMSIDDLDQRNFYLRYPTVWSKVMDNLTYLRQESFEVQVMQTISVLNFFYLDEFYQYFISRFPGLNIAYNEVTDPPYFSPLIVSPEVRKKVILGYEKKLPEHLQQKLENLYINNHWGKDQAENFIRVLEYFDQERSLSWKDYFPLAKNYLSS